MEGQFEQDLYNESFFDQLDFDETDTLQQRIKRWMMVVDRGGPMPNDVYDYTFDKMFGLYRKTIDPEKQEIVQIFKDKQIIPKTKNKKKS